MWSYKHCCGLWARELCFAFKAECWDAGCWDNPINDDALPPPPLTQKKKKKSAAIVCYLPTRLWETQKGRRNLHWMW
jgi:hypothetical protein